MKALTLTQPWADLVALGEKRIETRSWRVSYRGPVAIHAAKGMPPAARDFAWTHPCRGVLGSHGHPVGAPFVRGAVVAIAWLHAIDVIDDHGSPFGLTDLERGFGDYTPGRWAWRFASVVPMVAPIPARGSLGLWEWTPPAGLALPA